MIEFISFYFTLILILVIIVYQIVISFFEFCILTTFFNIKTCKYLKLLKILEAIVIGGIFFSNINRKSLFILLFLIYFIILIYDLYEERLNDKDFSIYTLFIFIDFFLTFFLFLFSKN